MALCALCNCSINEGRYVFELSEVDTEGDSIFERDIFINDHETEEITLELSDAVCNDCIDIQGFYLKSEQPRQQGVVIRDLSEAEIPLPPSLDKSKPELCAICGSASPLKKISRGISLKIESEKICSVCVQSTELTLDDFCKRLVIPQRKLLTAETLEMIHAILGTDDCVGLWIERVECNLCTLEGKNITVGVHEMEVHVQKHHHDLGTGGRCRKNCDLYFRTDVERTSHERYCGAWCRECGKCYLKFDAHFENVHQAFVCPATGCVGTFRSLRTACKHVSWYHLWKDDVVAQQEIADILQDLLRNSGYPQVSNFLLRFTQGM